MSTQYRSLVEVIKSLVFVEFEECRDGCLWYVATCADETAIRPDWDLVFRIPLTDVAGGVFPAFDDAAPRQYQRWIRKELELYKEEQALIAKAKAEWDPDAQG